MHFQPPRNEMKCVLCIKESYSKGKKVNIFWHWQRRKKISGKGLLRAGSLAVYQSRQNINSEKAQILIAMRYKCFQHFNDKDQSIVVHWFLL